jgi:hypothetical protein
MEEVALKLNPHSPTLPMLDLLGTFLLRLDTTNPFIYLINYLLLITLKIVVA